MTGQFLNTTDIPTVFLDSGLRNNCLILPRRECLGSLPPTRPAHRRYRQAIVDDDLLSVIQQLLRNLIPREKEVRSEDGRGTYVGFFPTARWTNRIDGVVITFVDITDSKSTAEDLALHHARL